VIISDKTIKVGRTVRCLHQSSFKAPSQHFNGLDFWCRQLWPGISYCASNRWKVTLRLRWTGRDDEHASRYGRHYRVVLRQLSPVLEWRSSSWCTKHLVCGKLSFNWQASGRSWWRWWWRCTTQISKRIQVDFLGWRRLDGIGTLH